MGKVAELVIKERTLIDDGTVDNVNISYKGSLAFYKTISSAINDLRCNYGRLTFMRDRNEVVLELYKDRPIHIAGYIKDFRRYDVELTKLEFCCAEFLTRNGIRPIGEGNTYTCRLLRDVNGHHIVVIQLWNQIAKHTKTKVV